MNSEDDRRENNDNIFSLKRKAKVQSATTSFLFKITGGESFWASFLLEWILLPLLRLPFYPLKSLQYYRKFNYHWRAAVQIAQGPKAKGSAAEIRGLMSLDDYLSYFEKKLSRPIKPNERLLYTVSFFTKLFFGRPLADTLTSEKVYVEKILLITIISWIVSFFCFYQFLSLLFRFGVKKSYQTWNYYELNSILSFSTPNDSISFLLYALIFFTSSLIFLLKLRSACWSKNDERLLLGLTNGPYTEEVYLSGRLHAKTFISSISPFFNLIYIEAPTLLNVTNEEKSKIYSIMRQHNLLYDRGINFVSSSYLVRPGRRDGAEALIIPKKPVASLSLAHGETTVANNLREFEERIISPMKDAVKKPGDRELAFWGIVNDENWDGEPIIFNRLQESPHSVFIGSTGAGKTQGCVSMIYAMAKAYPSPKIVWYFADGKNGSDFDALSEILSPYPVAKYVSGELAPNGIYKDPLAEFANIVYALYGHFEERSARFREKSVKNIYEYRAKHSEMPLVMAVMDEFVIFRNAMNFDKNVANPGTLANMIDVIIRQGRSAGIHLIFVTQRYQESDLPSVIRSNVTNTIFFNVNAVDQSNMDSIPDKVSELSSFQCVSVIPGKNDSLGQRGVITRFPYLGDGHDFQAILGKLEPIGKELKKVFDYEVVYDLSDTTSKKTPSIFAKRIQCYLKEQEWEVHSLTPEILSQTVQFEIRHLRDQFFRQNKIGVSILYKNFALDRNELIEIQQKFNEYEAILIFLGEELTNKEFDQLSERVRELNESTPKLIIEKKQKYQMKHFDLINNKKNNKKTDFVLSELRDNIRHSSSDPKESTNLSNVEKIILLLTKTGITFERKNINKINGVLSIIFRLPGGHKGLLIVGSKDKEKNEFAIDKAKIMSQEGFITLFVSISILSESKRKALDRYDIKHCHISQVDDITSEKSETNARQRLLYLMKICSEIDGVCYIHPKEGATILVKKYNNNGLIKIKFLCNQTKQLLLWRKKSGQIIEDFTVRDEKDYQEFLNSYVPKGGKVLLA